MHDDKRRLQLFHVSNVLAGLASEGYFVLIYLRPFFLSIVILFEFDEAAHASLRLQSIGSALENPGKEMNFVMHFVIFDCCTSSEW